MVKYGSLCSANGIWNKKGHLVIGVTQKMSFVLDSVNLLKCVCVCVSFCE